MIRIRKFTRLFLFLLVFGMPVAAMTLEEAARKLGSPDEKEVQQAQDALWAGGVDSMALLERVIFKGEGVAVNHAKHVRRCIVYGVPTQTPMEVLQSLLDFHRLEKNAQQLQLQKFNNEPSISSLSLACLHSRCAERNLDEVLLKSIEGAFERKLRTESGRYGLQDHQQALLLTCTQAMLVNNPRMQMGEKNSSKVYAQWVEKNPELPMWLDRYGAMKEYSRLNQKKALNEALIWFGNLKSQAARNEIDDRLESWCKMEIKDWGKVEPSARMGALLLLQAEDRQKVAGVYLQYHKADPAMADKLREELRVLEVERLINANEVAEACRLASRKMGEGMEQEFYSLWRLVGAKAQQTPAAFKDGLPSLDGLELRSAESFLMGFLEMPRRDSTLWWPAVEDFQKLLKAGGNADAWYQVLSKSSGSRDLQIAIYANEGRFEEAMADARTIGHNGYYIRGLVQVLRKQPELCEKIEASEKNKPFLQSTLTEMYSIGSDLGDIREIMRITKPWQEKVPDLFHSDTLTRGLAPYVAVEMWDAGRRSDAIRLIAGSDLRDTGKRLTAGLLETLKNDEEFETLARGGLPDGAISDWLEKLGGLKGGEFEKRCETIERFDRLGMLDNQKFNMRSTDLKKTLQALWDPNDTTRIRRWIETCYWMYSGNDYDDLALMAGLFVLVGDEGQLLKMSESPRAAKRPVHQAVLLHMLGAEGDMKLLLKGAGDEYHFDLMHHWHGLHEAAVLRKLNRGNKGNISVERDLAVIFEKDQARAEFSAYEIRSEVTAHSWVITALLGLNLDQHLRKGVEQYGVFETVARIAEEPMVLPALEERILKAAAGQVKLPMGVMASYLETVRYSKDKQKARGILGRWLELSLQEIEQRGGWRAHEVMYRTFVDCGWEMEAKQLLRKIDEAGGELKKFKPNQIYQLGGWACGIAGLDGPGWKLIRLEYPEGSDVDAFYEMSRMLPLEFAVDDAEALAKLLRKHQAQFDIAAVREILGRWAGIRYDVRVAKTANLEEHLDVFLAASRKHADASPDMQVELKSRWAIPMKLQADPSKGSVVVQDQGKALKMWNEGKNEEARRLMKDLMVRTLLDESLPREQEFAVTCGVRTDSRDYEPHQLFIRSAQVVDLPLELAGAELEILCRMHLFSDDYLIEAVESVGLHELALTMQRVSIGRGLKSSMNSVTTEDVPRLRRLECKVAMDKGRRDEAIAAFQRFVRADPYQAGFMLQVRQWFVGRNDQEGVNAVDKAVIRFFEDRLLLLPGYERYQRQIDKWQRLTAGQK